MDCEGIDRHIDSINGAKLNEPQNYDIGRRYSLDLKSDSSGLRLLNICKEASLRIVNGRLGLDKEQWNFTYQSVLGKSVIDYILLQPEMFDDVMHFAILQTDIYSANGISRSFFPRISAFSKRTKMHLNRMCSNWD